jgi:hypothetical protein
MPYSKHDASKALKDSAETGQNHPMNRSTVADFRDRISAARKLLLGVSKEQSDTPVREGGWSRKQILGHLIDSALNNHQRFVRAALDGFYEGPSYDQNGWVTIHGYANMPWNELLNHWYCQNELLCNAVERIPEARLASQCRIGDGAPVTLVFLVQDYLAHLDHHLQQIAA